MSERFLSDSLQTKRRCRPSRTRLRSSGPSMRRTKRSSSFSPSRRESNQDRPFPSLGHEHCPRMQGVAKVLNPVLRMGRLGLQGGVTPLKTFSEPEPWFIPLTEMHRPKVGGCRTDLTVSRRREEDCGFKVKVFALGGGLSKKRSVLQEQAFWTEAGCLSVQVPITVQWEDCRKNRQTIQRVHVMDIAEEPVALPIGEEDDKCRSFAPETGNEIPYAPAKTGQTKKLELKRRWGASWGLGAELGLFKFGLRAEVSVEHV